MPPDCVCENIIKEGIWTGDVVTKQRTRHTRICGQALSDNVVSGPRARIPHSFKLSVKSTDAMCHQGVR